MEIEIDQTTSLKVIPMNPEVAQDLEIQRKALDGARACPGMHRRVVVDEQARTITCSDCGFAVDPFEYILAWANDGDRRMAGLSRIETQRKVAQAEHDFLARRIKNLRAQLKRAGAPQTTAERSHFDRLRWNPHLVSKSVAGPDSELLFSQRRELGQRAEAWMREHGVPATPFNVITALVSLGVLVAIDKEEEA